MQTRFEEHPGASNVEASLVRSWLLSKHWSTWEAANGKLGLDLRAFAWDGGIGSYNNPIWFEAIVTMLHYMPNKI